MRKLLSIMMLAAMPALAQVSSAPPLLNFKGTSPPANCVIGRLFFDTDATAGKNIYGCTSADTWTLQGDGTGTPGGSSGDLQYNNAGSFGGITPGSGVVTALGNATNAASGLVSYGGSAGALTLTTPTATSLAIGGATIGSYGLNVTGTANVSGGFFAGALYVGSGANGAFGSAGLTLNRSATSYFGWAATNATATPDTYIGSPAAATLQLGAADAASPVAQTLKAQGVVAGTSNTAGPDLSYYATASTGNAAGGSHKWYTSPAGSSGTGQNAGVLALTIDSTKLATFAGGINVAGTATMTGINASGDVRVGAANTFYWLGRAQIYSSANSELNITGSTGLNGIFLSIPSAANLQLGKIANGSPIANTLTIGEASRAATDSNVSGANGTIASGNGTGNAAVSSLLLQSPVAVGSGTGAQTLTTGATIQGGMLVLTGYAVASLPTGITGGLVHITDQLTTCPAIGIAPTGGGSVKCVVFYNGSAWVGI